MNDQELAATIREAAGSVFSLMLGLPLESGPEYRAEAGSEGYDGVIALVPMGGSWTGSGRIICGSRLACRISSAMLMAEHAAVNEEVLDAMGEMANMIIGNVKTAIEEKLGTMILGLPTVIYGRNYRARSSGVRDWLVTPFQCGDETLDVQFFLAPSPPRTETAGGRTAPLAVPVD